MDNLRLFPEFLVLFFFPVPNSWYLTVLDRQDKELTRTMRKPGNPAIVPLSKLEKCRYTFFPHLAITKKSHVAKGSTLRCINDSFLIFLSITILYCIYLVQSPKYFYVTISDEWIQQGKKGYTENWGPP